MNNAFVAGCWMMGSKIEGSSAYRVMGGEQLVRWHRLAGDGEKLTAGRARRYTIWRGNKHAYTMEVIRRRIIDYHGRRGVYHEHFDGAIERALFYQSLHFSQRK
jgi:hypothetical protein